MWIHLFSGGVGEGGVVGVSSYQLHKTKQLCHRDLNREVGVSIKKLNKNKIKKEGKKDRKNTRGRRRQREERIEEKENEGGKKGRKVTRVSSRFFHKGGQKGLFEYFWGQDFKHPKGAH